MKRKSRVVRAAPPRNRVAIHPLLRKGHVHDKSTKALRKQARDRLRKDLEGDHQVATAVTP